MMNGFGDIQKAWKPDETKKLIGSTSDGIGSDFIPTHYKEYPIKKVIVVVEFDAEDVINQTKETFTDTLDVTKKWKALK